MDEAGTPKFDAKASYYRAHPHHQSDLSINLSSSNGQILESTFPVLRTFDIDLCTIAFVELYVEMDTFDLFSFRSFFKSRKKIISFSLKIIVHFPSISVVFVTNDRLVKSLVL